MIDKKKKRARLVGRGLYIVALAVLIACALKVVWYWDDAKTNLGNILSMLYPFLLGLFIAYLINPLVDFFNRKLFREYSE